ncbi:uncharacterized protein LOC109788799 [Cajanus cajan]|nr:uncharacterized protein LOC109788799 [Cajanus cajan]
MQKEEREESVDSLVCPSFSAYSSDALHRVADQVTRNDDRFSQNDDDDDFEFVAFGKVAEGVFLDAASPAFPIFDRDLAAPEGDGGRRSSGEEAIQITLGKLLMDDSPSCSSSEVEDELENVPPGTYCVWKPKATAALPCRKSKSTGSSSSRRWKLLDLLRRSNSEGKESVVFLTPSAKKKDGGGKKVAASGGGERKLTAAVSAHEALYVRNREMRREDKRRSYLPYRQDLVGFCVNLNAMGKAFPLHF